jgi:hypothetical protein
LKDKYLVFTSKISFLNYQNNIENLIFEEKILTEEAKQYFNNKKLKELLLLLPSE